ncbi:unnamed protein product, partial [Rotaria sp. Silwood2]
MNDTYAYVLVLALPIKTNGLAFFSSTLITADV